MIETGMAEKADRDKENRRQKLGLVWRNRKKISQIIKDYFYLPFFLLIILWSLKITGYDFSHIQGLFILIIIFTVFTHISWTHHYLRITVYMPAKRELQSGLLDQPAMCTTLEKLNTGLNTLTSHFFREVNNCRGNLKGKVLRDFLLQVYS